MTPFSQLPFRLRAYVLAHVLVVGVVVLDVPRYPPPQNGWLVSLLLISSAVLSTWRVELTILQAKMTLTFAVVCLALLVGERNAALLCAVVGALVGCYYRPIKGSRKLEYVPSPPYRVFFNVMNCALSCIVSAYLFDMVKDRGHDVDSGLVLGIAAFTVSYFLLNTLGVSLAVAFQHNRQWYATWKENFLWTGPGYLASASIAAGTHLAFGRIGAWSLLLLGPLYIIYYSYRLYMDRLHLFSQKVQQDLTHIQELNQLNQAIISSLATAIDAKDRYTRQHINRVQRYATTLAEAAGLSGPELQGVATAAIVHDIGKLGIPDQILGKPGKLTRDEFRRLQAHVDIGAEILSPVPFPFPVVEYVLTHHERWDGNGYPRGLKSADIPIGGRIISLVDVFDALTSDRPYRRAMSYEEALQVIKDGAGRQFDPRLVELFEGILPQVLEEIERTEAESRGRLETPEAHRGPSALTRISEAAAEMAAVCDVARSLAKQENMPRLVQVVVERALALLPVDTAVLYLRSPSSDSLTAVSVGGKYQEKLAGMTIRISEGIAGCVAENQQARANVSASLDVARRFRPEETIELNDAAVVPLTSGAENLGALAVYTVGYNVLGAHHLNVLNILAEHTAAAIQNLLRVERNEELAYTDSLTGLANSRALFRMLEELNSPGESHSEQFSLVIMDLDRFKEVNDIFGHVRGDQLLRQVAEALRRTARSGDLVCRYAGDEFVLVLPHADLRVAEAVTDRVRVAIEELPAVAGWMKIGASIGAASCPEDSPDGSLLLHLADRRMYENKYERRGTERLPLDERQQKTPAVAAG